MRLSSLKRGFCYESGTVEVFSDRISLYLHNILVKMSYIAKNLILQLRKQRPTEDNELPKVLLFLTLNPLRVLNMRQGLVKFILANDLREHRWKEEKYTRVDFL